MMDAEIARHNAEMKRAEDESRRVRQEAKEQHEEMLQREKITEKRHAQEVERLRENQRELEKKYEDAIKELKDEGSSTINRVMAKYDEEKTVRFEEKDKSYKEIEDLARDHHRNEVQLTEQSKKELFKQHDKILDMAENFNRQLGQVQTERALASSDLSRAILTQSVMDRLDMSVDRTLEAGNRFENVYEAQFKLEVEKLEMGMTAKREIFTNPLKNVMDACEEFRKTIVNLELQMRETNDDRKAEKEYLKVQLVQIKELLTQLNMKWTEFEVALATPTNSGIFGFFSKPKNDVTITERASMLNSAAEELFDYMRTFDPPKRQSAVSEHMMKDLKIIGSEVQGSTPAIASAKSVQLSIED